MIIQSIVNYCDSHTPKCDIQTPGDELELKSVERARIARDADILGKIPLIGAVVGLARMITSFAVSLIALCGRIVTKGKVNQYFNHVFLRGIDEFTRGCTELFTLGCGTFFIDRGIKKRELTGLVDNFAYGRYVYYTSGYGVHHYSNFNFKGKVGVANLQIRIINCSAYYATLRFAPPSREHMLVNFKKK